MDSIKVSSILGKTSRRGFTEVALLVYIIAGMALFFVPNPVSSSLGIGIRPNKTVQSEKVELIKDEQGVPIAYKTTVLDQEVQQKVGFFEWLRSLPFLVLLLMGLGIVFPPVSVVLGGIYRKLQTETKKIVVSVDDAMQHVKDDELKKKMYLEMGNRQDSSTKNLVDKIQGKK